MSPFIFLLLTALIAAPLSSHAADAPPAPIKAAFGNTLLTIDPDGRSRKLWLKPDGTWTGLSRRGLDLAGRWRMDGDKVCLSQSRPALPGSLCEVIPDDLKVGGPATKARSGMLKLVEGHVIK